MNQKQFFTDFLQLSSMKTIAFIVLLLFCFTIIRKLEKKKVKFSLRMFVGTGIGLVIGLLIQLTAGFPSDPTKITWLNEVSAWYSLVGNGYMDLLKMLVVPLILISITRVIMNMEGDGIGKLAAKTISTLVGLTVIAAVIGTIIASVGNIGVGMATVESDTTIREITPIVKTLQGLLPSNIVKSMVEQNVIAVVIFAVLIGLATRRQKKKYEQIITPFMQWIEGAYKVILSVAMTVIKFMPYAMIALFSNTISSQGLQVLLSVGKFIVLLYVGLLLMFLAHMAIAWTKGVTPMAYLKGGAKPLVLAFTSRSSLGTLPVLIETLDKEFGIEEGIASFVGSLGSNMGMNGCAGLYPAMVTIMLAQMTNTPMDVGFYIMLAIVIVVSSFGIAGLPGAATLSISVVISGMGMGEYFPLVGAIVAIDPILDMGRTFLNVSGTMVSAIVVGKQKED